MAKKKKIPEINLLPQEEFQASTIGRVLQWLLSTFRYIVITTEMIVMVAFLSRFWLDAKSSDLTDAINQKKAVIASYLTFENQFRATQQKITTFNNFSSANQSINPVIRDITANVPSDITLTEISINNEKVLITATTQNENSAGNFITHLNSSSVLTNISLDSVESKQGAAGISFTVKAIIKGRVVTNGS